MADTLIDKYPTLFYHKVEQGSQTMHDMDMIRWHYLELANQVLARCPECRSKSIAMTHLEESCMRAIQSLALAGELIDPRTP